MTEQVPSPQTRLSGVVPPVVTPLTADHELDLAGLERVVEHLIRAGVDGLFVLGSTGEGAFLTDAERAQVIGAAVTATAGRVPVLAGVIDVATRRVIDHAHAAVRAGADAIVATVPFYGRASRREVAAHYRQIAGAVGAPLVAYDIPEFVGAKLDADLLAELAHAGVLAAVKDSSGDDGGLRRLLLATRELPEFSVLTGSEVAVDTALMMGADGVVPGLANVDPEGYVRLHRAAVAGRWDVARAEQERLVQLFTIVDVADRARVGRLSYGVGAFKEALSALGLIDTPTLCPPFSPLTDGERATIADRLTAAGLVVGAGSDSGVGGHPSHSG